MSQENAVVIGYHAQLPRTFRILFALIALLGPTVVSVMLFLAVFESRYGHWWLVVEALLVSGFMTAVLFCGVAELRAAQKRFRDDLPAFVVTTTGIEDYASALRIGPLAWDEIERIWCYGAKRRIFENRLFRTPILPRYRFLVIQLKDRSPLDRLPRYSRWITRLPPSAAGWKYLRIAEAALETQVDDVLKRLNAFYQEQVQAGE